MNKFLVLLVFALGKGDRVQHRVLCVVTLAFGSKLCSFCCGCSICVKKYSQNFAYLSFIEVSCAYANVSE